jgi:hypothetical protein
VDCARRAGGPQAAAGKCYRVSLAQAVSRGTRCFSA